MNSLGCLADYSGALRWVKENGDTIDALPDSELDVTHRMCCSYFTPMDMAVIAHRRDVVEKLIARGARTDNLEYLLEMTGWESEESRTLLDLRGDCRPGFDMLRVAIQRRDAQALAALLDRGADPDSQSTWGDPGNAAFTWTLMDVAVGSGDLDCVTLLVRRGAAVPPNILNRIFGSSGDVLALARLFVDAGALIDPRSEDGETPLWRACSVLYQGQERAALVSLLIQHTADVSIAPAASGTTPLMFAAARGDGDVLVLLLRAGADPQLRDREGRTALDFARMCGRTEAEATLLAYTAGASE